MKSIYLIPSTLLMLACGSSNEPESVSTDTTSVRKEQVVKLDTLTSWSSLTGDSAVFNAPNGKFYMVYADVPDTSEEEQVEEAMNKSISAEALLESSKKNEPCDSDIFDGKDRKAAKWSVASAETEVFADLEELLSSLIADEEITKKITSSGENSNRVKEEKRNVRIEQTWLYTFKIQSDEDFHLIIGTTPDVNTAEFFNIEISGLPENTSPNYEALYDARKMFFDFFGEEMGSCFAKSYGTSLKFDPIEVSVEGSLFFDKLHADQGGPIGPSWARGSTYWEIHPITSIEFH